VVPGYPKDISATWPGLPSDLDAALFWSSNLASYTQDHQSGTVYFFKVTILKYQYLSLIAIRHYDLNSKRTNYFCVNVVA